MPKAPTRVDETTRLRILRELHILDTPPEERFDRLTRIATEALGVPSAIVSLVDSDRQWFKSRIGMATCGTDRSMSFCAYVVHDRQPLLVPDATADPRTADLPNVIGEPGIRAYAGFPLAAAGGHVLGSFGVIDYRPREFTEHQLGILRDLAAIAEAEITNVDRNQLIADLASAKEAAERATRAQRRLTATVGHDIRTSLNGIVGVTDLLEAGVPVDDYLSVLRSSSRSLLALINDLLDYSKIQEDRLELNPQPIAIRSCAADVLDTSRLQVRRSVRLAFDCADDVPAWVMADPLRLRQILLNLVGNAVKFTHDGFIQLTIRRADSGNLLEFTLSDTGEGVSEVQAAKLFRPFSQADPSVAERAGGTGLGLSISKMLVEQMGGSIHFESRKGVGSKFTFTIDAPAQAAPAGPAVDRTHLGEPVWPLTILATEDNRTNQRLLGAMLRKLGHDPQFADTGEEAIHKFANGEGWDVVLMDVGLPDIDGLAVTRKLRSRESPVSSHRIPIIGITANADEESRVACLEAGMTFFLPKPISLRGLSAILAEVAPSNPE